MYSYKDLTMKLGMQDKATVVPTIEGGRRRAQSHMIDFSKTVDPIAKHILWV